MDAWVVTVVDTEVAAVETVVAMATTVTKVATATADMTAAVAPIVLPRIGVQPVKRQRRERHKLCKVVTIANRTGLQA